MSARATERPPLQHDLPDGVIEWAAATAGGEVTRLHRHVARREAWVIDIERPDGDVVEGFLRLERDARPDNPWSLQKETGIVSALASTPVPVPAVYGWNDDLSCALFERVRGRSDLDKVDDAVQQRAVYEHFIDIVAALHTLDLDALSLPPMQRPTTPEECALGELDLLLGHWQQFLSTYHDPLLTYGVQWLRRQAPAAVARVSLVQGDTGPVNFLFDGRDVTAVIDWEWGHLGDPLEDLGNICVREFWNPSGGLDGLFDRYARASGIPANPAAVRYYRVQQQVRGMIPIHAVTVHAHPQEPVAWFLAYRYVGDRATCEAIAEAMGIVPERPDLPADDDGDDVTARAAQYALEHDILPHLDDPLARSRAADVGILVGCVERRRRLGPGLAAVECDELGGLLGRTPASVDTGLRALDDAIARDVVDEEALVRYLTRRAYRDEWLWAPACALYPGRNWAPFKSQADPGA
jgi:aminoglycoside phosphotransferase (APT) family kinase protein